MTACARVVETVAKRAKEAIAKLTAEYGILFCGSTFVEHGNHILVDDGGDLLAGLSVALASQGLYLHVATPPQAWAVALSTKPMNDAVVESYNHYVRCREEANDPSRTPEAKLRYWSYDPDVADEHVDCVVDDILIP